MYFVYPRILNSTSFVESVGDLVCEEHKNINKQLELGTSIHDARNILGFVFVGASVSINQPSLSQSITGHRPLPGYAKTQCQTKVEAGSQE